MSWMTLDGWWLSARLAWSRPWMRWSALISVAASIGISIWFLATTLPSIRRHDAFIYHYNVYLGIDDVRVWPWVFFLPSVWVAVTLLDLVLAYGLYRSDALLARALATLAFVWAFPWAGALFYLSLVNL